MRLKLRGLKRAWLPFGAVAVLLFGLTAGLKTYASETFVQGYQGRGDLQTGMIAAVTTNDATTVEAAPASNPSRVHGVVVEAERSSAYISGQDRQVLVATGGTYPILVSDEKGTIKAGDYITISSIDGVGANAGRLAVSVVGRALQDFDGRQDVLTRSDNWNIGRVNADISIAKNPASQSNVPSVLADISQQIAGKNISPLRVYAAALIFFVAVLSALSLLWVGVRNAMIAIGRNPLSRTSIYRGLGQVIAASGLVFVLGILGVYLVLKI
ncbi:MAG: hypothetical protein WD877_01715 [Candidatus Saccharimonadales bacterium]